MKGLPAASFSMTGFRCFTSCAKSALVCVTMPAKSDTTKSDAMKSNAMKSDLMPLTWAMPFLPDSVMEFVFHANVVCHDVNDIHGLVVVPAARHRRRRRKISGVGTLLRSLGKMLHQARE